MKARARWRFGCYGESTPARLIEGEAVALKSHARMDTHSDVVVVVMVVVVLEWLMSCIAHGTVFPR